MKAADVALLAASAAAVVLVVMARRDSQSIIASQHGLAGAQLNSGRYGGTVANWSTYGYIDNDAIDLRGTSLEALFK